MDIERFHELAGFFEYDEGMTRFEAETQAATRMGFLRHEAMNEIRTRNSQGGGNIRQASPRDAESGLPGMQPHAAKENGPMPFGDVQAGRDSLVLSPLLTQGG